MSKARDIHIDKFQLYLDNKLSAIDLQNNANVCKYIYCKCLEHRSEIDSLCHFIIDACVTSGLNCISLARSSGRCIYLVGPNRLNLNETGHFSGTGYGVNLVSLEVVLFMTS